MPSTRPPAEAGGCVLLGRAAAVVLADHAEALHVRLDGSIEGRVQGPQGPRTTVRFQGLTTYR